MTDIITIRVIDNIFKEADIKLSSLAKMLYINLLTYHFTDKKPTVINAVAFDIFKNDIPNYEKYQKLFEELHKGNLILIQIDRISFNNCWGKHINRDLLDKVDVNVFVSGFQFQKPEFFKQELLNSQSLYELSAMKHKITKVQLDELINLFIKEQTTFEKNYSSFADCIKHFTYWLPKNIHKSVTKHMKSSAKLLGE